jgi:hypothetical protein
MKPIQFVLIAFVMGAAMAHFTRTRSRLVDRLLVFAFAVAGLLLLSVPAIPAWLATGLEVSRGFDVVVGFALFFLCYLCYLLYSRLREQEDRLVELTRSIALANAVAPDQAVKESPQVIPFDRAKKKAA